MKLHYLQHVPFEDLASIEACAVSRGFPITVTRLYAGEPLPEVGSVDFLVVLGGPMNVDDEDKFPWLADEKRFIEQAIRKEKPVLGICLGSQLIADVLGAKVFQNRHQEIGWFPVELTDEAAATSLFTDFPKQFSPFHWHGDTFDLPAGAIHLAHSEACRQQAFLYDNRVLGLQFHLEATPESIRRMIEHEIDDLTEGKYVQTPEEILSKELHFQASQRLMSALLEKML